MPKAASAAGAGIPVSGDHSNSTEISAPVVETESIHTPISDDPSQLGSHRDDAPAATEVAETEESASEEEVNVPARLKGKSLAQVYQEFAGLEKEYSRQGNELGETRSLMRQMLEQTVNTSGAKASKEELPDPTEEDFALNPKEAIQRTIEKQTKPLLDKLLTNEQRTMILDFNSRHPGFFQEAETSAFQDWVKGSPYRTKLFLAAGKYDMDAAEDLYQAWADQKPAAPAAEEVAAAAEQKRAAVKRVTTETGGAGKGAGGKSGKRIFKQSELSRLYIQNRDLYNEMGDEIRQAFAEGRVRKN